MTRLATVLLCAIAVTGCERVPPGIGPEGGELVSDDGRLTLTIPAGALDETVDIQIAEVSMQPEGALGATYQLLPLGTSFIRPATVTFELEDADIEAYTHLSLVSHREGRWFYMADRQLNMFDMTLSASAGYLSVFAVVGEAAD